MLYEFYRFSVNFIVFVYTSYYCIGYLFYDF